jgi:tetratricopeptide (TPR) repeat protein
MKFDCYIMLGACYMQKGQYEKSIDHYKTASQIKGLSEEKLARLHFSLGLAYEAHGMTPEAIEAFNLALKFDPSISEAQEKIKKMKKPH